MSIFENPILLLKQKNVNLQGWELWVPQIAPYHLVLSFKKYYTLLNLDRVYHPAHSPPSALFLAVVRLSSILVQERKPLSWEVQK